MYNDYYYYNYYCISSRGLSDFMLNSIFDGELLGHFTNIAVYLKINFIMRALANLLLMGMKASYFWIQD